MTEEWEIRYIDRRVADAPAGEVVLEWSLNKTPESQWRSYFISSQGGRSGTQDFLSRVPQLDGSRIRFQVREEDLEKAVVYAESKIDGANQLFDTYVMPERRERETRRQAEEAAKEARLTAARKRLEQMDS